MYQLGVAINLDKGKKRERNEDAIGYRIPDLWHSYQNQGALFVVADGVGSLQHSELASERLVRLLLERYYQVPVDINPTSRLHDVIVQVNEDIFNSYQEEKGATTLVAGLIYQDKVIVAHVGDSRMYADFNRTGMKLYTQDHTQAITDAQGRTKYKLTQAIGHRKDVDVTFKEYPIKPGDRLLFCSDGLSRYANQQKISSIQTQSNTQENFVRQLVNHALNSGGADNISVVNIVIGEPITNQDAFMQYREVIGRKSVFVNLNEPVFHEHQPALIKQETTTQSKRTLPWYFFLIGLVLLGALVFFINLRSGNSDELEATHSPPVIENIAPIDADMSQPESLIFIFDATAPTVTRVNGAVISFVIEVNSSYGVTEEYSDPQGVLWYRLYDARNGQYGWIQETDLPSYRIGNDT